MTEEKKVIIPITVVTEKRTSQGDCPCGCCGLCCK